MVIHEALQEHLAMKDIIGVTQGRVERVLNTFERFVDATGQRKWAMVVNELGFCFRSCGLPVRVSGGSPAGAEFSLLSHAF